MLCRKRPLQGQIQSRMDLAWRAADYAQAQDCVCTFSLQQWSLQPKSSTSWEVFTGSAWEQFSRSTAVPETALPRIQLTRRYWYSSKYLEDTKWGKAPSKAEKSNLNIRYHKAATPHLQPHGLTQRPAPARSCCSHTDNRNWQKDNSNLRCSQRTG